MSIAVGVAASDGLVLATDSRTIQQRDAHHRLASDRAEKLFRVGDHGVATYGMAMIGGCSIRGLMEDFAHSAADDLNTLAADLGTYFHEKLREATPSRRGDHVRASDLAWPLGFLVAGYGSDGEGCMLEVKVRSADSTVSAAEVTTRNPGVVHRGQSDAIGRLLEGIDWSGLDSLVKLSNEDRKRLGLLGYDLILPTAIEDAAKLAEFLVQTQIGMQDFHDGTFHRSGAVPGCGGPIRMIGIGRTTFEWLSNPGRPLPTPASVDAARGRAVEEQPPVRRSA